MGKGTSKFPESPEDRQGKPAEPGGKDQAIDPAILEIIQSLGRDDKKKLINIPDPEIIKINGLEVDDQSNKRKNDKDKRTRALAAAVNQIWDLPADSRELAEFVARTVPQYTGQELLEAIKERAAVDARTGVTFLEKSSGSKLPYASWKPFFQDLYSSSKRIRAEMPLSELLSKRKPTLPKLRHPKPTLNTMPPRRKHQDDPALLAFLREEIERLAVGSVTKSTIDDAPELDTKRLKELLTVVPSPDLRKFEPKIIVKNRLSDSENFPLRPSHTLSTFTDFDDDVGRLRNNEIRKKEK